MTWLRSVTGDLRYVAWGRYRELVPSLDYLPGARGRIEQAFLRTPFPHTSRERDVPEAALAAVEDLTATLGAGSAALLLYTGYYKDTWFVGPIRSARGQRAFVKLFQSTDDAAAEVARADQASRLVQDGAFRTLRAVQSGQVVSYDIVSRAGSASDRDAVAIGAAIARGRKQDDATPPARARWAARSNAVDAVLAGRFDHSSSRVGPALAHDVAWGLAHGDVTPWNIIPTHEGLVLIDYERVALRPAFFDVVYAGSQGPALRGSPTWARENVDRELRSAGVPTSARPPIVAAALAAAIVEATEDLVRHPENADRSHRLISSKLRYLEET